MHAFASLVLALRGGSVESTSKWAARHYRHRIGRWLSARRSVCVRNSSGSRSLRLRLRTQRGWGATLTLAQRQHQSTLHLCLRVGQNCVECLATDGGDTVAVCVRPRTCSCQRASPLPLVADAVLKDNLPDEVLRRLNLLEVAKDLDRSLLAILLVARA
eukprot:m.1003482 g.1003482  ORF g.1003482 m.1003482 type:complete len:159 (+) comp24044_c0_seq7:790-1266(+)